jgi:hypothetical protein
VKVGRVEGDNTAQDKNDQMYVTGLEGTRVVSIIINNNGTEGETSGLCRGTASVSRTGASRQRA